MQEGVHICNSATLGTAFNAWLTCSFISRIDLTEWRLAKSASEVLRGEVFCSVPDRKHVFWQRLQVEHRYSQILYFHYQMLIPCSNGSGLEKVCSFLSHKLTVGSLNSCWGQLIQIVTSSGKCQNNRNSWNHSCSTSLLSISMHSMFQRDTISHG